MNTISQNEPHWRNDPKFTVASPKTADDSGSKVGAGKENDGLTFDDFLDIINPLHHIPVIGTVYRKITDDDLSSVSRVLGGSLFLGPLGAVSALANILVDKATGKNVSEHALALFENIDSNQPKISSASSEPITIDSISKSTNFSFSSNDLTKKTNSGGHTDPVTAWAMAEASYRQSASKQLPTANNATYRQQNIYKSIASDTQTTAVTKWARLETSYRKAAFRPGPPPTEGTKPLTAQAPAPRNNVSALSALKNNLLASGNLSIEHATAEYTRQQSMAIKHSNSAVKRSNAGTTVGAIATGGGWFSDTMLSALGKQNEVEKPARLRPIIHQTPSKVF